jgi:hypothetical protein
MEGVIVHMGVTMKLTVSIATEITGWVETLLWHRTKSKPYCLVPEFVVNDRLEPIVQELARLRRTPARFAPPEENPLITVAEKRAFLIAGNYDRLQIYLQPYMQFSRRYRSWKISDDEWDRCLAARSVLEFMNHHLL